MTDEDTDTEFERKRHIALMEQGAPFASLYYNLLHGDEPVKIDAISELHNIATHSVFLLEQAQSMRPDLVEALARTCEEWPVRLNAVNFNKASDVPPEVIDAKKLPIAQDLSIKRYGHGKRGPKKDSFYIWLLELVGQIDDVRKFRRILENEESSGASQRDAFLDEADPSRCLRALPDLSKKTAGKWADAIAKHFTEAGFPESMPEEIETCSQDIMQKRKNVLESEAARQREILREEDSVSIRKPSAQTRLEQLNTEILGCEVTEEDYLKALRKKISERLQSITSQK